MNNEAFAQYSQSFAHPPALEYFYVKYISPTALSASSAESDVVSSLPEYLGIPYAEFANSATPSASHPWTVQMSALATAMRGTGKPLLVQLLLTRSTKIANAVDNN